MARAGGGGGPCAGSSRECANFSIPKRWGCVCVGVIEWVSRSIDQSVAGGVCLIEIEPNTRRRIGKKNVKSEPASDERGSMIARHVQPFD